MSEGGKKGVRKLTKQEKQEMAYRLNDLQKRKLIDYDCYLVKDENAKLKEELQMRRRLRQFELQMKSISKSKLKGSGLFKTEVPDAFLAKSASMKSGVLHSQLAGKEQMQKSGHGASTIEELHASSVLPEANGSESLPAIRRKGTSYHRKFLNEVRSRSYKTYLTSLHAVKEYKQGEIENSKLKQRLLKTKMTHQMSEFKNLSKQAWKKVDELIVEKEEMKEQGGKGGMKESKVIKSEKTEETKKKVEQAPQTKPKAENQPPAQNKPTGEKTPPLSKPAGENKPAENPAKPNPATNAGGKVDAQKNNPGEKDENY